jgi:hypothetical protein
LYIFSALNNNKFKFLRKMQSFSVNLFEKLKDNF